MRFVALHNACNLIMTFLPMTFLHKTLLLAENGVKHFRIFKCRVKQPADGRDGTLPFSETMATSFRLIKECNQSGQIT